MRNACGAGLLAGTNLGTGFGTDSGTDLGINHSMYDYCVLVLALYGAKACRSCRDGDFAQDYGCTLCCGRGRFHIRPVVDLMKISGETIVQRTGGYGIRPYMFS